MEQIGTDRNTQGDTGILKSLPNRDMGLPMKRQHECRELRRMDLIRGRVMRGKVKQKKS